MTNKQPKPAPSHITPGMKVPRQRKPAQAASSRSLYPPLPSPLLPPGEVGPKGRMRVRLSSQHAKAPLTSTKRTPLQPSPLLPPGEVGPKGRMRVRLSSHHAKAPLTNTKKTPLQPSPLLPPGEVGPKGRMRVRLSSHHAKAPLTNTKKTPLQLSPLLPPGEVGPKGQMRVSLSYHQPSSTHQYKENPSSTLPTSPPGRSRPKGPDEGPPQLTPSKCPLENRRRVTPHHVSDRPRQRNLTSATALTCTLTIAPSQPR